MAPTVINSVVSPATPWFNGGKIYDLVDLATIKQILGLTDGTADANLRLFITQASSAIRRYCNRTFQVQTYQDLFWAFRDPYPWQLPGGVKPLQLAATPIAGPPCLAGAGAPAAPGSLSAAAGGALPAATYFVRVTYQTPTGESPVSAETNLVMAADTLLQVGAPPSDPAGMATGWNIYVGTAAGQEQRQNGASIALGSSWTMGTTGLQAGPALPSYVGVTLNANVNGALLNITPQNLVENKDFRVDYELGQLTRLFLDGYPAKWEMLPLAIVYQAGYTPDSPDIASLQDACIRLVRGQYFAAKRDPNLRAENIEGVWSAQYWFASGPGAANFPPDVEALLDDYRVPMMG